MANITHYYSPSTQGFYVVGVHNNIPDDVIEVDAEKYQFLIEGASLGKKIVYKSRKLQLADQAIPALTWEQVRKQRESKLRASDWTQMPDTALSAEEVDEWRKYRQDLRNITETFDNPDKVVWPVIPGETEE